ncbi:BON domain-containing protein [Flavobacterium paronense]|uniref:BON domain-containing protein n=1 Tax=Flavobacterium paronense TaxID=1392775 RepID=A0ABV5GC49_9FLAO|nr:BON domain-containing protein [Flavobacterium paronense]MDN3677804.1 BON domain-containing protein [Flavobacterium paronense]
MNANEVLQKKVQEAIAWEPLLDAASIGVIAKDGIVTLTGTVDNYTQKLEAENAAKKVAGVKAVVEKIEIDYNHAIRTDEDIAKEAIEALKWNVSVPEDKLKIVVSQGWVYLQGVVDWNYQKHSAKKAVENIPGVKGVVNSIQIKSADFDKIEKRAIESAIHRNSSLYDKDIEVAVSGNVVTLTGNVTAYFQKEEAERIAWNSPGVWTVNNLLAVNQKLNQAVY